MSATRPTSEVWPPAHTFEEASTPAQRSVLGAIKRRRQLADPAWRSLCTIILGEHAQKGEPFDHFSKGQAMFLITWFARSSEEAIKAKERQAISAVFGGGK